VKIIVSHRLKENYVQGHPSPQGEGLGDGVIELFTTLSPFPQGEGFVSIKIFVKKEKIFSLRKKTAQLP
jgi:hypothetical protein